MEILAHIAIFIMLIMLIYKTFFAYKKKEVKDNNMSASPKKKSVLSTAPTNTKTPTKTAKENLEKLKEGLKIEMAKLEKVEKRRRDMFRLAVIMLHGILIMANLIFLQDARIDVPAEYAKNIGNNWTWGMIVFFIQLFVITVNTLPNTVPVGMGGLREWFGYMMDSVPESGIVHLPPGCKLISAKSTMLDFEIPKIMVEFGAGKDDATNSLEMRTMQEVEGFFQYRIFNHRLFRMRYQSLKDAERDMKKIAEGIMRRILGKITPANFIAHMELHNDTFAFELLEGAFKNGLEIGDTKMFIFVGENLQKALGLHAEETEKAKAEKAKGKGIGDRIHEEAKGTAKGIGEIVTGDITPAMVLAANTARETIGKDGTSLVLGGQEGLGPQIMSAVFGGKTIFGGHSKERQPTEKEERGDK